MSDYEIEQLKEENRKLRSKLEENSFYIDRLNMIVDNSYEWIWEVDANGVYTYASEHVTSVLGYKPQELIGKTPFDFMSEEEAERVAQIFMDISSKESSFSKLQNNCIHKDGHTVYTETSGQPIYKNNEFAGYIGIDFNRTDEFYNSQEMQDKNISLEKALSHQHELLLNVTNSISDLLFYKDTDYRYIGCNQAFSNFIGLPIDFIIGKTDYELFSQEHANLFRSMDKRVIDSMESYSNHEWVEHADGRKLYMLTQKSPLFNTQASLIGMVGIARDISHEQELETKLKESNSLLVDAQSIAKIGHWDWDIVNGGLFWSDEIYKIFGYSPQQFDATYEAFLDTIHPQDKQMVIDATQKAIDEHTDYNIFHRIILPDGSQKNVHEIGYAIYNKSGDPVQMIGTVQDVTKLNNIQKELAEQKEAFENIFEFSSDGLLLIENGRFTACNQATIKMMRASGKEDILNMHPSELSPEFQPDGRRSLEKAEEMMQTCIRDGYNHFEWVHTRKDGEQFWAEVLLTRLNIGKKQTIHVSLRDISQRKLLEENLEMSNLKYQALATQLDLKVKEQSAHIIKQSRMAQMGELLSMIAHQWRQPLSTISTISSTIKIKLALTSDDQIDDDISTFLHQRMDDIEAQTQSLSNTINDFRTLYMPDKVMKEAYPNEPVDRALKLLGISLAKNGIQIKKIYNADILLYMHTNEVMQVILNLIKNCEDNFIEKKTKDPYISIETIASGASVKIILSDNGGGIEKSIIEKIFDPYFSTKGDKNGTGLGLYMSKIIIEQHHKGKLNASNTETGASFCIEIPIAL